MLIPTAVALLGGHGLEDGALLCDRKIEEDLRVLEHCVWVR